MATELLEHEELYRGLPISRVASKSDEPVHQWFELSYSQYLTVPRSVLQNMPSDWQRRFVACLEELDALRDWRPKAGRYWVALKDEQGRYDRDPLMDYRHPDRSAHAAINREEA